MADFTVDTGLHRVTGPKGALQIDGRVASILALLSDREGTIVAKDQLASLIWERAAVTDDAIAKAISRARSVLREAGLDTYRITSVRGVGYRLDASQSEASPRPSTGQPWLQSITLFVAIIVISLILMPSWIEPTTEAVTIQVGDDRITVLNPDDDRVRFIDPETGVAKAAREYQVVD